MMSASRQYGKPFGRDNSHRNLLSLLLRFFASAFSPARSKLAIELIIASQDDLFKLNPENLTFCLIWSAELRSIRDATLNSLLSKYGTDAARIIIRTSEHAHELPACIPDATRLLTEKSPEDNAVPIGLGLSLQVEPEYAIQSIVRLVNEDSSLHKYDQSLLSKIQTSDQRVLFKALAADASSRDLAWHVFLAQLHHDIVTNIEPIIEWLETTIGEECSSTYNASLIISYLSEPPTSASPEAIKRIIEFAGQLHSKFGTRKAKDVCQEWNLNESIPDYETLVAIALACDVAYPPNSVDAKRVLEVIRELPSTYKALGGAQLEADVAKGIMPPYAELYGVDLKSEAEEIERQKSNRSSWSNQWAKDRLVWITQFRAAWETGSRKSFRPA